MPPVARSLLLALLLAASCVGVSRVAPATSAIPTDLATTPSEGPASTTPTVVGMRIRIPRLGIDLPVEEGDPTRDVPSADGPGATPEGSAFHFPGTAVPGQSGNSYIYAHARTGMFLTLWQAVVGDRIEIGRPDGATLVYSVVEIDPAVPSNDTSWLWPTGDERLTLQTSTGPTPAYPRFIVVARRSG